MKDKIANLGIFLALSGLISSVLYFFDMNVRMLRAIDANGPLVGWGIRIGLIVGGGLLALLFSGSAASDESGQTVDPAWAAYRQRLYEDPRFIALWSQVQPSFGRFQIAHATLTDAHGQVVEANHPHATFLSLYLTDGEQRVLVNQRYPDNYVETRSLDPATWQAVVG
ncbi:MAG: hypothetical protein AAGA56_20515 [Myxococcota bacterium]